MKFSDIVPPAAAKTCSVEVQGIAARAASFTWTKLAKALQAEYGYTPHKVKEDMVDFARFMVLKAAARDLHATLLSPTVRIDRVWHLMLQFPADYMRLCQLISTKRNDPKSVLFPDPSKELIDHNPLGAHMNAPARERRYKRMLAQYRATFGCSPAEDDDVENEEGEEEVEEEEEEEEEEDEAAEKVVVAKPKRPRVRKVVAVVSAAPGAKKISVRHCCSRNQRAKC